MIFKTISTELNTNTGAPHTYTWSFGAKMPPLMEQTLSKRSVILLTIIYLVLCQIMMTQCLTLYNSKFTGTVTHVEKIKRRNVDLDSQNLFLIELSFLNLSLPQNLVNKKLQHIKQHGR